MRIPRLLSIPLTGLLAVSAVGAPPVIGASPSSAPLPSAPVDQPSDATAFPTPEDAVRSYLDGLARGDVDAILAASAIDEMAEGFRFDLFTDRLGALVLTSSLAPAEYPFYAEMNRHLQSARILSQALMLSYGLLSAEEIDGRVIAPADLARAQGFIEEVDPARLADLAVQDIRFPQASLEQDERYLANAAASAATFGADEQTERLVLFESAGQLYDLGFTLLRYGDGWLVSSQVAPLAGTSPMGTARPTTAEEYEATTSG